jgi:glycerol-3-phosphate dehydrogenase
MANSAIVHAGFDAHPGTLEAVLVRRSAALWPTVIAELGVPFLDVGAVMLARSAEERSRLAGDIAANATVLGVATELIDRAALRDLVPAISPDAIAALHIPGEGVIDPFWLTRAYAETAVGAGAQIWTEARVVALAVEPRRATVTLADGRRIVADQVVDCAGLWADYVAALAGDTSFSLTPRKGQFLVSESSAGVERIVLPIPGPAGKGMLVTPIVFGGIMLGPTAEDGTDKWDRATDATAEARILSACGALVPAVEGMVPIRRFAGVRAVSSTGDYIIRRSTVGDRLYLVAGIRSTGIGASPAIAEHVATEILSIRRWRRRQRSIPVPEAEWASQAGPVICPCRSVASAEVDSALSGPLPPMSTDALKRRSGAGFGDCQGNQCLVELTRRLGQARDRSPTIVRKHSDGSWILTADGWWPVAEGWRSATVGRARPIGEGRRHHRGRWRLRRYRGAACGRGRRRPRVGPRPWVDAGWRHRRTVGCGPDARRGRGSRGAAPTSGQRGDPVAQGSHRRGGGAGRWVRVGGSHPGPAWGIGTDRARGTPRHGRIRDAARTPGHRRPAPQRDRDG